MMYRVVLFVSLIPVSAFAQQPDLAALQRQKAEVVQQITPQWNRLLEMYQETRDKCNAQTPEGERYCSLARSRFVELQGIKRELDDLK